MKRLRQHKWIPVAALFLAAAVLIGWSLFQSKYGLTCTPYKIYTDKVREPIRVLQLTDLHNSTFGKDNRELIELSAAQAPDLILITGDLLNAGESETGIATDLISELCGIAPVYVSMGNHELEHQARFGVDPAELYEAAGAVALEKQYEDVTVNGQPIRLGGIYGYCLPEKYLETDEADPEECAFLTEFQNTDRYTILLCHIPVCWMINDGLNEWNVDCVFSGHTHGGQVVLPLVGGVYAPDLGWFPGKLEGLYPSEDGSKTMVLSRGLGNSVLLPRWNNVPELVVVDILPQ